MKKIVYWEPILFTTSRKEAGFKIANVIDFILTRTLENGRQTECARIRTRIMPHLLLEMKDQNEKRCFNYRNLVQKARSVDQVQIQQPVR